MVCYKKPGLEKNYLNLRKRSISESRPKSHFISVLQFEMRVFGMVIQEFGSEGVIIFPLTV